MRDELCFAPGEDRLECPQCGTHNLLDADHCWNCIASLAGAKRLPYHPGHKARVSNGQPPLTS